MPELLARVDIGEMYLDHGEGHGLDGIVQRHAGMGVAAGVDDGARDRVDMLVQAVDQRALVIGLERQHGQAELAGAPLQARVNGLQRHRPVDARLTPSQQVQVGAAHDENALARLARLFRRTHAALIITAGRQLYNSREPSMVDEQRSPSGIYHRPWGRAAPAPTAYDKETCAARAQPAPHTHAKPLYDL